MSSLYFSFFLAVTYFTLGTSYNAWFDFGMDNGATLVKVFVDSKLMKCNLQSKNAIDCENLPNDPITLTINTYDKNNHLIEADVLTSNVTEGFLYLTWITSTISSNFTKCSYQNSIACPLLNLCYLFCTGGFYNCYYIQPVIF